jgi:hypothetical protein
MPIKKEETKAFSINIPLSLLKDISNISRYKDRDRSKQVVWFLRKSVVDFKENNPTFCKAVNSDIE